MGMSKESEKIYLEVELAVAKKKFIGAIICFCAFACIDLFAFGVGWFASIVFGGDISYQWLVLLPPFGALPFAIYYFFQYTHAKIKLAQFVRANYICPNCKRLLPKENVAFCVFCGKPLKS